MSKIKSRQENNLLVLRKTNNRNRPIPFFPPPLWKRNHNKTWSIKTKFWNSKTEILISFYNSRTSHILTVTWLDCYCDVVLYGWRHYRHRVTWLDFYCGVVLYGWRHCTSRVTWLSGYEVLWASVSLFFLLEPGIHGSTGCEKVHRTILAHCNGGKSADAPGE